MLVCARVGRGWIVKMGGVHNLYMCKYSSKHIRICVTVKCTKLLHAPSTSPLSHFALVVYGTTCRGQSINQSAKFKTRQYVLKTDSLYNFNARQVFPLYGIYSGSVHDLASQPLHREEGSGQLTILDLGFTLRVFRSAAVHVLCAQYLSL